MKKNILFAIIAFAIISCTNSVQLNQLYEESSSESWIILNYIKYDKKQTFDDLLIEKVYPAIFSYVDSDEAVNNANKQGQKYGRLLRPKKMNDDSTWTFIFMADPFIKNQTTMIRKPLIQKYGEDESKKILDIWFSCFAKKGQESFYGEDIKFSGFKNNAISKPGNNVMVGMNYIKSKKNQQFENVTINEILPVVIEYRDPKDELHNLNQKAIEEMRFLRPKRQNNNKSWSYVFMADPYFDEANYFISKPFSQKYGKDNVAKILKDIGWNDSFDDKGQILYYFEEVDLSIFK